MKGKFLIIFSAVILFSIFIVPNMFASSTFVIGDDKAGGYEYTITKEQNTFSWKIGHQGNITVIDERQDNSEDLVHFMNAVSDSKVEMIEIIISAAYFLIVVITTLILYKKNKKMLKDGGPIIAVLAGIALYKTLVTTIDLNRSLADAKFYYLIITS